MRCLAGAANRGLEVENYANVEYLDTDDRLPRYTVYVEVAGHASGSAVEAEAACEALDAELGAVNDIYALFRRKRMLERVR